METNLLDRMLDTYLTGHTPVTVTLQNKIRVSGRIRAFDSYVIVMEGHKQEILYRHAISCLCPLAQEEHKRQPAASRPAVAKIVHSVPAKSASSHKPRHAQPQTVPPSATESLNNNMKDGLLKWMQEQKAAK
jgi:RNA chaperone Hfq